MILKNQVIIFCYSLLFTGYVLLSIASNEYVCLYNKCSPKSGYEPFERKILWNEKYIRISHNCYAFALNNINLNLKNICKNKFCRGVFPQPGHFCNSSLKLQTCFQLKKRIVCDNPNIYEIDFKTKCKRNFYKIGFATNNNSYYHFYRQNRNGLWLHKDASRKISKYDASKNLIINPRLADRNYDKIRNYVDWCSFMCVPSNDFIKTNMTRLKNGNPLY